MRKELRKRRYTNPSKWAFKKDHHLQKEERNLTKKIDALLIHKFFGLPIFLFLMWLLFQLTFTLGQIPMDYIESGFNTLGEWVKGNIQNTFIASALADGAIAGVGAVVLFLPNIIILFLGIALLETTGYMSRVAFLLDGILHKFGTWKKLHSAHHWFWLLCACFYGYAHA